MKGTAGQLVAIARSQGAKLSCILVSEVHPDSLPQEKSAGDLQEYRASKVREFLEPDTQIYFDTDGASERSLGFTQLNVLYIEDGWQLYRMTPPGQEGRYVLGVTPFLSWWANTHPTPRAQ